MQYTQLSRRSAGGNKIDWEKQYLTFIPVEDAVFSWAERAVSGHLEYSINGGQTWVTIADGESTPTVTAGSKVIWRGDLRPTYSTSSIATSAGIGTFSASRNYHAYGNTMSLLFYDNYYGSQLDSNDYRVAFGALFYQDTHILAAPELPATTLSNNCYQSMFSRCTSLTTAPELPATTLVHECYRGMFYNCTGLTTAPELPATTLSNYCYYAMFSGCTSLTTAPELPATTLADYCYVRMFEGCHGLTTAPALPATTLKNYCYQDMFSGCTRLNYIKCLAITRSASNCLTNWVANVASSGTFVKASSTSWSYGSSGVPSGWTVVDDNS